jgi:hypothetical protein
MAMWLGENWDGFAWQLWINNGDWSGFGPPAILVANPQSYGPDGLMYSEYMEIEQTYFRKKVEYIGAGNMYLTYTCGFKNMGRGGVWVDLQLK